MRLLQELPKREKITRLPQTQVTRYSKITYLSFLITFSIILLFVSIPLTFSEWKEEIIMIVILRLIPLFMNIANGKEYGKSYITHTILGDLQFRLDTVINYMEWKLNKRGEINESKTFM